MSVYSWFAGVGPSGFGYGSTAAQVTEGLDLSAKTILVTGCNSGIGYESARVFAKRGAQVIGLARTKDKAATALNNFEGRHLPVACELSEPESVRAAVDAVLALDIPLDAILCNAGIMALPERTLVHGLEAQFFTNHVGHFMLVTGLLKHLHGRGRVVMTSSSAHDNPPPGGIAFENLDAHADYAPWTAYGQSKLANVLFARQLARRLAAGQTANAVHPGVIFTNLGRHQNALVQAALHVMRPLALKNYGEGAATQVYVAVHPDAADITGAYWSDCNVVPSSEYGRDDQLAERLWERTEAIAASV